MRPPRFALAPSLFLPVGDFSVYIFYFLCLPFLFMFLPTHLFIFSDASIRTSVQPSLPSSILSPSLLIIKCIETSNIHSFTGWWKNREKRNTQNTKFPGNMPKNKECTEKKLLRRIRTKEGEEEEEEEEGRKE